LPVPLCNLPPAGLSSENELLSVDRIRHRPDRRVGLRAFQNIVLHATVWGFYGLGGFTVVMPGRFRLRPGFPQRLPDGRQKFLIIHGFLQKRFRPGFEGARARFGFKSRAETTMTGITARNRTCLSLSITMKPLPAARPRSRIIRSGLCVRASARAPSTSDAKKVS
jgi:hypothetical protein